MTPSCKSPIDLIKKKYSSFRRLYLLSISFLRCIASYVPVRGYALKKICYIWCQKNLVRWPNRAFLVRGLARVTALCFWARPLTPTVPFSTQVYKWVPANLMLGGDVSYFAWRHSVSQSDMPCKTEVPFSTKQAKKTVIVWKLFLFFTTSIRFKLSRSFCLCLWYSI